MLVSLHPNLTLQRLSLCVALWLLMGLGSAFAQVAVPDPQPPQPVKPVEPRPFQLRFGILRVAPVFMIRDLGIDNNVFDTVADTKSDFTVTPTAGLEGTVETVRFRAELNANVGFVYYRKYSDERALNSESAGRGEFAFSKRLKVFGSGGYTDTSNRLAGEIDARARRFLTSGAAGMTIGLTRRMEALFEVGATKTDIGSDAVFLDVRLQETLSNTQRSKVGRLNYTLTPLTTVTFIVRDSKLRYPFFAVKDENGTEVRVAATFKPRAFVSGAASVGVRTSRPLSSVTPRYKGFVADLQLHRKLGDATELGLAFERTTGTSFDPTTPYYVSNRYGVLLRRHLFRRVETWLAVDRTSRDYRAFTNATASPGSEASNRFTGVVSTQVTKRLRLSWHMDMTDRRSFRSPLRAYDGFRSGFIVSYGAFTIGNRSERGGFGPW